MTVWFAETKGGTPPPVAHVRIETASSRDDEAARSGSVAGRGGETAGAT